MKQDAVSYGVSWSGFLHLACKMVQLVWIGNFSVHTLVFRSYLLCFFCFGVVFWCPHKVSLDAKGYTRYLMSSCSKCHPLAAAPLLCQAILAELADILTINLRILAWHEGLKITHGLSQKTPL